MDNLAHALTGIITASAIAPAQATDRRVRFFIAAALITNIPDIDIVLAVFGDWSLYHFHHRGFTHSLLGQLVFIPLSAWLWRRILGAGGATGRPSWRDAVFVVVVLLWFSHYFLDYLTSYGTLFLYPFSFERYSWPLMFIIDPALWGLGAIGVLLLSLPFARRASVRRGVALVSLLSVIALWGWQWQYKSASALMALASRAGAELHLVNTYPQILAPMNWLVLLRGDDGVYHQALTRFDGVSPRSGSELTFVPGASEAGLPEVGYDRFCPEASFSEAAQEKFAGFRRFAEYTACYQEAGREDCRCVGLKYNLLLSPQLTRFSDVRIDRAGELTAMPRSPVPQITEQVEGLFDRDGR